ncbi:MAG: hypothetical protein ACLR4Z_17650 [Butyricicoccaceae bacterium]
MARQRSAPRTRGRQFDLPCWSTPQLPIAIRSHGWRGSPQAGATAGVILLARRRSRTRCGKVEDDGVFVVPKTRSRVLFMQALRMTTRRAQPSERTAKRKPPPPEAHRECIRLIDRACLLIECCGMSEPEAAHSYIEQRMNRRCPKRDRAEHR